MSPAELADHGSARIFDVGTGNDSARIDVEADGEIREVSTNCSASGVVGVDVRSRPPRQPRSQSTIAAQEEATSGLEPLYEALQASA